MRGKQRGSTISKKWRLIKLSELGKKLCKYEFCVHKIKWLSHLSNRASKKSAEFFLELNLTRTSFKTCSSFRHLINYFKPHRLCHRLQWRQRKVKKIYILIFWELQLHLRSFCSQIILKTLKSIIITLFTIILLAKYFACCSIDRAYLNHFEWFLFTLIGLNAA